MQTINNNQLSFQSTFVHAKNVPMKKPLDALKSTFELQGFSKSTPAKVREKINGNQVGILISKDGMNFVGKDREADKFIARKLTEAHIDNTYIQDTPESNFNDGVFTIIA